MKISNSLKKVLGAFNQCYINGFSCFVFPYSAVVLEFLYFLKINKLVQFLKIYKIKNYYYIKIMVKYSNSLNPLFYFYATSNDIYLTTKMFKRFLKKRRSTIFPIVCCKSIQGFCFVNSKNYNDHSKNKNGRLFCILLPHRNKT